MVTLKVGKFKWKVGEKARLLREFFSLIGKFMTGFNKILKFDGLSGTDDRNDVKEHFRNVRKIIGVTAYSLSKSGIPYNRHKLVEAERLIKEVEDEF